MPDIVDAQTRSRMMAGIRGKDTKPETSVRNALHRRGYRYRLHNPKLPGKPDLAFTSRKAVIMVHGCFWHWHGCPKGQLPKSQVDYWLPKLEQNVRRDRTNIERLELLGWRVLVIWQCQTVDADVLGAQFRAFLDEQKIQIDTNQN